MVARINVLCCFICIHWNLWLYENKLKLLAQIHSHPSEAYHSKTDDEFPIMTTLGGLSIVVPYFAKHRLNHLDWAYYRLFSETNWIELNQSEIKNLIKKGKDYKGAFDILS